MRAKTCPAQPTPKRGVLLAIGAAVTAGLAMLAVLYIPRQAPAAAARALSDGELARIGPAVISVETFQAERARQGDTGTDSNAALLERLIRRELLFAEAQRVGFDHSDELQTAWKNLVIQRFQERLETEAEALPRVTAEDVEAEYARHPERYALPAQVHAALIQLPARRGAEANARRRGEEVRAEAVREAANASDFGPLAAATSIHPASRRLGGDLGWLTRAQANLVLPAEVVEELFVLSHEGEISPVMTTTEGTYLLKLIATRAGRPKPLAAVHSQIEYKLQRSQRANAEQALFARLREQHRVEIHPERLASLTVASPPLAQVPPRTPGN